jgi:phenylacetaldehyde dehydrogenase
MIPHKLSEQTLDFIKREHGFFINNSWFAGSTSDKGQVVNPADEKPVAEYLIANADDVEHAVVAARTAFEGREWKDMAPNKRTALLNKLAQLLEERHEIIAELITLENGKLYAQSKSEVLLAANTFRYYAGWATKIEGDTIDLSLKQAPGKKNFAFTLREAVGVVAAIVPWNFPISIASWKLAPLLAAGCTCILKPSELSPLSSLYMADLFAEAGFPAGVVNVVTGDGATGAALTSHPGIDKITFTGSTKVGKIIGKTAMDNMTDLSLELGGKSPAIVFEDANLEEAAKGVAMGIFRNGGQVCVAGSRVYIQETVFEQFIQLLEQEASKLKISDGFDPEAALGPLVSDMQLQRVCNYLDNINEHSQELITGGKKLDRPGFYIEPSIIKTKDNDNMIVREEIFGPVLMAIPFKDLQDALNKANDSIYGLSSTVWTRDINKAMNCVSGINAGWVFVNAVARSDPHFPIGGNKQSGLGRELGKTGLYAYTKLKSVNIVFDKD